MITLQIDDSILTIDSWRIDGDDREIVEFAEAIKALIPLGLGSPSDPNPDHSLAVEVLKYVGGKILQADPLPHDDDEEERIY